MHVANIYEAKTHFSKLVEEAMHGEEVVISKAGKPILKLVPYQAAKKTRKPGYWKGRVTIADDFDELPAELLSAFKGEEE